MTRVGLQHYRWEIYCLFVRVGAVGTAPYWPLCKVTTLGDM